MAAWRRILEIEPNAGNGRRTFVQGVRVGNVQHFLSLLQTLYNG